MHSLMIHPQQTIANKTWWLCIVWSALIVPTCLSAADNSRHTLTTELRAKLESAIASTDSFKDRFDAEVWLTDMSTRLRQFITDEHERIEILKNVHQEAHRANLHPELVLAVIEIESRFDRYAISRAGAQGLMQIMPFWLKELNQPDGRLFDIKTNLRLGCTILRHYLDKEKDDLRNALARYNGSRGNRKYPDKVFTALSERWFKR